MANNTVNPESRAAAPFIFADGAQGLAHVEGVIMVELIAIVPTGAGNPENLVVAHLRCSIAGAKHIRDAIDQAIALKPAGLKYTSSAAAAPVSDKPN
jgi:hypothetical protein